MGCRTQAYADNSVIVVMSNHLDTATDLMQSGLRVVNSWCKTKELSVNSEKTEVVLFTRKRKTDAVVRLTYQSMKLNITKGGYIPRCYP